ncbi:MAG: NAD(P)-binding domain-containing protein, partial [Kiritimatiellaeota bacterium]|nr:NAD(P)-binding domain-containing protein [Kiritimatiellota bacterium]
MRIAFVGAGKMATAIVKGMLSNGKPFAKEDILASDVSEKSAELFTREAGVPCGRSAREVVETADFILLAVKPQNIRDVMSDLRGKVSEKTIISIAAGIKLETLLTGFGVERVIRVMPNTPLMIGEGATALAPSPNATENDIKTALDIFAPLGVVHQVDENLIDAVTALSGSGPA